MFIAPKIPAFDFLKIASLEGGTSQQQSVHPASADATVDQSAGGFTFPINFGCVYLDHQNQEELEIVIDNDHATTDHSVDLYAEANTGDQPETIKYERIIDTNWTRQAVQEVYLFDSHLDENEDLLTLQSELGNEAVRIKAFKDNQAVLTH